MPRFTVVIPSYNRAGHIGATLRSLMAQTERDFEALIVDGGSTDGTGDVVRSFPDPVVFVDRPGTNVGQARNVAIQMARGEYCVFLDSDDLWFPWTLACFRRAIDEHPGARPAMLSGTLVNFVSDDQVAGVREGPFEARAWPSLLHAMPEVPLIPTMATAVRTDIARAAGGFLEERVNAEDVDFWLRLGDAPGFIQIRSPVLAGYRQTPGGLSCDMRRVRDGVVRMFERDRDGVYPGPPDLRANRRRFIAGHARPATLECIHRGDLVRGLDLYLRTLPYTDAKASSLKWALGVPVWALTRGLSASRRARAEARRA
jgi:glycosyltransferase involved in cell wall biosynthesis